MNVLLIFSHMSQILHIFWGRLSYISNFKFLFSETSSCQSMLYSIFFRSSLQPLVFWLMSPPSYPQPCLPPGPSSVQPCLSSYLRPKAPLYQILRRKVRRFHCGLWNKQLLWKLKGRLKIQNNRKESTIVMCAYKSSSSSEINFYGWVGGWIK